MACALLIEAFGQGHRTLELPLPAAGEVSPPKLGLLTSSEDITPRFEVKKLAEALAWMREHFRGPQEHATTCQAWLVPLNIHGVCFGSLSFGWPAVESAPSGQRT